MKKLTKSKLGLLSFIIDDLTCNLSSYDKNDCEDYCDSDVVCDCDCDEKYCYCDRSLLED